MTLRLVTLCSLVGLAVACDSGPLSPGQPATPLGPTALSTSSTTDRTIASRTLQGREDVRVNMQDACDPATFNAAIGPGTCTRNGGMQFDDFIAALTRLGFVGPWHFAPNNANLAVGSTFVVTNLGGEVHTFTEVEDFGGGIVPSLNQLARTPNVAPECTTLDADDFVPPGGVYTEEAEETGHEKYQCCIHPWMRLEADVTASR